MIKHVSLFFTLLFSGLFTHPGYSQYSFGMDLIPAYGQGNVLNPANYPKNHRLVISLPHIQAGIQMTPFSIFKSNQKDSSGIRLHPERILSSMDTLNNIDFASQIHTLSLGFQLRENNWIGIGHRLISRASIQFPETLARLVYYGNKPFIGKKIDLNTRFEGIAYQEFYAQLGFQWKSVPSLNLGIKFKILDGLTGMNTARNEASLYSNPVNYNLSGKINYLVNATPITSGKLFSNLGAAIDVGVEYQHERVSFSGAIIDLGMIKWNESRQLSFDKNISFEGLPLLEAGQSIDANFNLWIDSLKKEWMPAWEKRPSIRFLPVKIFLHSRYSISNNSHLSAFLFVETFNEVITANAGIGFLQQISTFLDIGLNIGFNSQLQYQIGNQIGIKTGNLHFFASLDNWISLLSISDKFRGISGQLGLAYAIPSNIFQKGNIKSNMNEKKFFRK